MKNIKLAIAFLTIIFAAGCTSDIIIDSQGVGGSGGNINVTSDTSSSSSSSSRERVDFGNVQHNEPCYSNCDCCGGINGPDGAFKGVCLTGCL